MDSYKSYDYDDAGCWLPQLDRILSSISHDLRNPLSIIRGNAQLAMMVNRDHKVEICLNRIIDAVDEINADLTEVGCLRRSKNITMTDVSLVDLLQDVIHMLKPLIIEAGIIEEYDMEPNITAPVNVTHMKIAIKHIIKNAIDAMPDGGVLKVTLSRIGDYACITVADTGKGIMPEVKQKLFKEVISTRQGARGFGLIMADQVIRVSHAGSLTYSSSDQGTTFVIKLPLQCPIR